MSWGRLAAAVGTTLMAAVCIAVVIGALLGFTWVVDRASELIEDEVAEHSAQSADGRILRHGLALGELASSATERH